MKKKYILISLILLITSLGFRYIYFAYYPKLEIKIYKKSSDNLSYDYISVIYPESGSEYISQEIYYKLSSMAFDERQAVSDMKYDCKDKKYKSMDVNLKLYEKDGKTILKYDGVIINENNEAIDYYKKYVYDFTLGSIKIKERVD